MEGHILKAEPRLDTGGDGLRVCGNSNGGFLFQQFQQPLRRAGGAHQIAPDFAERAHGSGNDDGIKNKRGERSRRHFPIHNGARAAP